jgi:hypothetical protein
LEGAFGKAGTAAKVFFGLLKKFFPYIAVFTTLSIVIGKVVKSFNEA